MEKKKTKPKDPKSFVSILRKNSMLQNKNRML